MIIIIHPLIPKERTRSVLCKTMHFIFSFFYTPKLIFATRKKARKPSVFASFDIQNLHRSIYKTRKERQRHYKSQTVKPSPRIVLTMQGEGFAINLKRNTIRFLSVKTIRQRSKAAVHRPKTPRGSLPTVRVM